MSEMYKVGIHLVAVNGVSGVLNSVASQLLGINKHVLDFNKSAGILGKTLTGAFAFAGGAATLAFMKTAVDRAKDLQHVQQKMLIGGVIPEHVAEATTKALAVSQQFGQKWVDVLETMNEIRNPLGGIEKSMEHIGQLGAAMTVLRGVDSKHHTNVADGVYNLVRSAEFRNAISGPEFDNAINQMVRAAVATSGRVNPAEFFQFSKYARGALPGLSDKFLYSYGPELAQEFKGSTAGTSLASLFKQISGGQMTTRGARLLDDLGMIERDKVDYDKHGRIVRTKPGAVTGSQEFASDPNIWAERLLGAMTKKGLNTASQGEYLAQIFGNRNAEQMIRTLMYQSTRLDRGAAGIAQTMNVGDAAKQLMEKDYDTAMNSFHAAWTNMLTALGGPLVSTATSALNTMSGAFNSLTSANPAVITGVAQGLTTLGVALAGGGIGLLVGGPVGAAIGAVAAGLAALAGLNIEHVTAALTGFASYMQNTLPAQMRAGCDAITAALNAIPAAIMAAAAKVWAAIKSFGGAFGNPSGAGQGDAQPSLGSPMGFRAPTRNNAVHIQNVMHLDGDVVHKSVSRRMMASLTHPTRPAYFDGNSTFAQPDIAYQA